MLLIAQFKIYLYCCYKTREFVVFGAGIKVTTLLLGVSGGGADGGSGKKKTESEL